MQRILSKIQGDRAIWLIVLLLSLVSLLAVYSSIRTLAYKYHGGNTEYYLAKHFALMCFGFLMMFIAHRADYRLYSRLAQLLLIISIPLLLYTLLFGSDINEAKRWLTLPGINLSFQTSDLAKLALIMYCARFLSRNQEKVGDFKKGFLPIVGTIALTCALIAPANLSSALVLFFTCFLIMFIGRVHFKYLAATVVAGATAFLLIIALAYTFPDVGRFGTWTNRLESFMGDHEESYQVQQAKIAVARGGLIGQGPGRSTQKNFLPHPYSDFIFAIVVEEYGLVGASLLILLYLAFLFRTIKVVIKSPGTFGALLAIGLAISLVIQALINMSVAVNLLPVTGLTLPLVSMGGTSIWFTSFAIGIILSVSRCIDADLAKAKEKEITETEEVQEAA